MRDLICDVKKIYLIRTYINYLHRVFIIQQKNDYKAEQESIRKTKTSKSLLIMIKVNIKA